MKAMENEDGAKMTFKNILRYIECGENAIITLNGEKYNISVDANDGIYYIGEESFENRESFINGLYNKTSIQLRDDTIVILNAIVDGTLKLDSSWEVEDDEKENLGGVTNIKHKLYRKTLTKVIITFAFIIFMVYAIVSEIISYTEINSYIAFLSKSKENYGEEVFRINKEIIAIILLINAISIAFYKNNKLRLKILFKHSRKQINEIEEKVIEKLEQNNSFSVVYDMCFFDEELIIKGNDKFESIKYEDIMCVLYLNDYMLQEKDACIITKNKKIIRTGNISNKSEFKKKILEKNSKVVFEKNIISKKSTELNKLNVKKLLYKDIIITCYKYFCIVLEIILFVCFLRNGEIVSKESMTILIIIAFFSMIFLGTFIEEFTRKN